MGAIANAMMMPRLPLSAALPTSAVRANVGPWILKMSLTRPTIANAASEFSMIVTTTSWAPVKAFNAPGMNPYNAPPSAPAVIAIVSATGTGRSATAAPASAAKKPPTSTWPVPPMLKSPALKPTPTASPVRTSGPAAAIVFVSACVSGTSEMASVATSPSMSRKLIPVAPSSRASYAVIGSRRSSCPWEAGLDRMMRIAPQSSANRIEMIGTIESA